MLLQVYLHAAIAARGRRRSTSRTSPPGCGEKMLRRNPHVFGDVRGDRPGPDQRDLGGGQGRGEAARRALRRHPARAAGADPRRQGPRPARARRARPARVTDPDDLGDRLLALVAEASERRGGSRAGAARRRTPGQPVTRRRRASSRWPLLARAVRRLRRSATDDEMAPPPPARSRRPRASRSPRRRRRIPVGQGDVSPPRRGVGRRAACCTSGSARSTCHRSTSTRSWSCPAASSCSAVASSGSPTSQRLRGTGLTAVTGVAPSGGRRPAARSSTPGPGARWCTPTTSARAQAVCSDGRHPDARAAAPGPGRLRGHAGGGGASAFDGATGGPRAVAQGYPDRLHAGRCGPGLRVLSAWRHGRGTAVGGQLRHRCAAIARDAGSCRRARSRGVPDPRRLPATGR